MNTSPEQQPQLPDDWVPGGISLRDLVAARIDEMGAKETADARIAADLLDGRRYPNERPAQPPPTPSQAKRRLTGIEASLPIGDRDED